MLLQDVKYKIQGISITHHGQRLNKRILNILLKLLINAVINMINFILILYWLIL
jgi:ammonia channel protein AmtB